MQPLFVQEQGPVSQEIPPRIWRNFRQMSGKHEIITAQQLKLVEFEIFSVNVTEKLGGYSKFPEEGNYAWRGPCVFYGLFEWKKSASYVNVLCKTVSHRTVEPPLFPGALTFNFISKDVVMVKSQIRTIIYEPDRGPNRQENK